MLYFTMLYVIYVLKHAERAEFSTIGIFVNLLMSLVQAQLAEREKEEMVRGDGRRRALGGTICRRCSSISCHPRVG